MRLESGKRCIGEPTGDLPGRWVGMITYRKAVKLLAPGDVIYTTDGSRVIECVVEAIHRDSVVTDQDVFFLTNTAILGGLRRKP